MSQTPYMADDGLYVVVTVTETKGKSKMDHKRIADPFETPARVSDPRTGADYGLLIQFTDEQGRAKQTVITAASLQGKACDICSKLAGLGLFIEREYQDALVYYLQRQIQTAPSADLATSTGWLTPKVYVLPDDIIGEQESGRAVYYGGDTRDHNYRTRGTLKEWQDKVARPCEGNSRLILTVCAGFAGPLLADAGEQSGGFHIWGKSSAGKTTALMCGGSVCGGGHPSNGFTEGWKTTSNGLETLLGSHNDGTLFLDEVSRADPRDIPELIYTAGNGSGKHRMTRELTAAPVLRWRVLLVSTGEMTIEAHAKKANVKILGGAAVRMIEIPADAGKGLGVFEDLHGSESSRAFADRLKSATLEYYGVAFREFLRLLTTILPTNRHVLTADNCGQFLNAANLTGAHPEVLRAANRMAVIAAAGEMAIELGILPWQPGAAIEGIRTCFNAWREFRGGDKAGHDEARGVEQVRGFIERYGNSRFEALPGRAGTVPTADNNTRSRPVAERAGYRRELPDGTIEYLVWPQYFKDEIGKGFDLSAVARVLKSRGVLRPEGKHLKVRIRVGNSKRDFYCIRDSILDGGLSE